MRIILILIIFATAINADFLYEGSNCTFKSQTGKCIPFEDCQSVKNDVMSGLIGFSEVVHCASRGSISLICCPGLITSGNTDNTTNTTEQTKNATANTTEQTTSATSNTTEQTRSATVNQSRSESACNKYSNPDYIAAPIDFSILEGIPTIPGEFPHMAALGYNQPNGLDWRCGGSLISDQYVLTAAHCVVGQSMPSVTRLGKTSLLDDDDGGSAVDVTIDTIIRHPLYLRNQSAYDIALIKLSKAVDINSFVRPACLHRTTEDIDSSEQLLATGWGVTNATTFSKSDVLLKVNLTSLDIDSCNKTYIKLDQRRLRALNDGHMCTAPGSRDTCDGDSGGPLQIVNNVGISTIVGVTSSGISCGSPAIPGIYTRVAFFVGWIEEVVWP